MAPEFGVLVEHNRIVALRLLAPDPQTATAPMTLLRFRYDEFGDLTEVINSSELPLRYDYDPDGRITRWTDRTGTEYRYTFDEAGRCVATAGTGGFYAGTLLRRAGRVRYEHDAAGRTRTTRNGSAMPARPAAHATPRRWIAPLSVSCWTSGRRPTTQLKRRSRIRAMAVARSGSLVMTRS